MAKDDNSSGGPPGGSLIVIALLTAGVVFVANKPLQSSRPAQPEQRLERSAAVQDIDARLWQDPFAAVAKARERMAKMPGGLAAESELHAESRLRAELRRQAEAGGEAGVMVLAVMISGGPYAERTESRLRTRHAVLSGLSARGFVPADSEHIGYFLPADNQLAQLPETVPFEAFEAAPDAAAASRTVRRRSRIVVLWLDSASFYQQPLDRLQKLARSVGRNTEAAGLKVSWRVLGPSSSGGLRAIIEEAEGPKADGSPARALDLRFISPAATVPDKQLLSGTSAREGVTLTEHLHTLGVALLRSTGTDDLLAAALVEELQRRGLNSRAGVPLQPGQDPCDDALAIPHAARPSTVAIVSEWDTLYGRTLRRQFQHLPAPAASPGTPAREGYCVSRWHYVRGLDGRLPGDAAPQSDNRGKKDGGDPAEALTSSGTYQERPEGQNQFDYLRRLGARMREDDAKLRRMHGPEGGIRAIGVLGNDVYDKLLVLQALQGELPHAIFFTTDLDARMFHPAEQAWARNLIVASNFGLRLDPLLQREIAPFRDSYQTAAYLGTLVALTDAVSDSGRVDQARLNGWFDKARLFEISRTGAFDYSPLDAAPGKDCRRSAIDKCRHIHPPGSPLVPDAPFAAVFLVAALLMLASWAPALAISRPGKRRLRRFVAAGGSSVPARTRRGLALLAAGLTLALVPPLLAAWAWPSIAQAITAGGKPLSLFDGISPWPTYGIRLVTLVLCVYLVWRAWATLAQNIHDVARDLRLGATRRNLSEALAGDDSHRGRLQRFATLLSLRFYRERPGLFGNRHGMSTAAVAFWKHFLVQNRAGARLVRTALCILLMSALTLVITHALGEAPTSPLRGETSRFMQAATTWPTGVAIQFIIFFVADATLLCVFFVRGLRLHDSNWPLRTLQFFERDTGVPAQYLDDWIDLQFVTRRTRVIGRLIYYPFIVLSLMLLARSSFFDDWNSPPSVYIVATLCYGIVLGCALALRMAAEESRRQAVEKLRNAILRAKGAGNSALSSQLEMLRDRVERLSDGAFAPYSRQPLLRAVLLPLLTFGGSSLFDYLTLLNL